MMDMMGAAGPGAHPVRQPPRPGTRRPTTPARPRAAEAQKITVAPGRRAQGIDFALAQVRLARVTGIVLNSEGKPVEGTMVTLGGRGAEDMPSA